MKLTWATFPTWLREQGFAEHHEGSHDLHMFPAEDQPAGETSHLNWLEIVLRTNPRSHAFDIRMQDGDGKLVGPVQQGYDFSAEQMKSTVEEFLVRYDQELQQLSGLGALTGRPMLDTGFPIVKYLQEAGFEMHPLHPNWYWRFAEHSRLDVLEGTGRYGETIQWTIRLVTGAAGTVEHWKFKADDGTLVKVVEMGLVRQDALEAAGGAP